MSLLPIANNGLRTRNFSIEEQSNTFTTYNTPIVVQPAINNNITISALGTGEVIINTANRPITINAGSSSVSFPGSGGVSITGPLSSGGISQGNIVVGSPSDTITTSTGNLSLYPTTGGTLNLSTTNQIITINSGSSYTTIPGSGGVFIRNLRLGLTDAQTISSSTGNIVITPAAAGNINLTTTSTGTINLTTANQAMTLAAGSGLVSCTGTGGFQVRTIRVGVSSADQIDCTTDLFNIRCPNPNGELYLYGNRYVTLQTAATDPNSTPAIYLQTREVYISAPEGVYIGLLTIIDTTTTCTITGGQVDPLGIFTIRSNTNSSIEIYPQGTGTLSLSTTNTAISINAGIAAVSMPGSGGVSIRNLRLGVTDAQTISSSTGIISIAPAGSSQVTFPGSGGISVTGAIVQGTITIGASLNTISTTSGNLNINSASSGAITIQSQNDITVYSAANILLTSQFQGISISTEVGSISIAGFGGITLTTYSSALNITGSGGIIIGPLLISNASSTLSTSTGNLTLSPAAAGNINLTATTTGTINLTTANQQILLTAGSGLVSIPGSGGCTVRNIQIGVVDAQTISTSTGNINLTPASTGTINLTTTNQGITFNSGTAAITMTTTGGVSIRNLRLGLTDANSIETSTGDLILRSSGNIQLNASSTNNINLTTVSGSISLDAGAQLVSMPGTGGCQIRSLVFGVGGAGFISTTAGNIVMQPVSNGNLTCSATGTGVVNIQTLNSTITINAGTAAVTMQGTGGVFIRNLRLGVVDAQTISSSTGNIVIAPVAASNINLTTTSTGTINLTTANQAITLNSGTAAINLTTTGGVVVRNLRIGLTDAQTISSSTGNIALIPAANGNIVLTSSGLGSIFLTTANQPITINSGTAAITLTTTGGVFIGNLRLGLTDTQTISSSTGNIVIAPAAAGNINLTATSTGTINLTTANTAISINAGTADVSMPGSGGLSCVGVISSTGQGLVQTIITSATTLAFTSGSNRTIPVPCSTSFTPVDFSVNTTTGDITYTGAGGKFLIQYSVLARPANSQNDTNLLLYIGFNGANQNTGSIAFITRGVLQFGGTLGAIFQLATNDVISLRGQTTASYSIQFLAVTTMCTQLLNP